MIINAIWCQFPSAIFVEEEIAAAEVLISYIHTSTPVEPFDLIKKSLDAKVLAALETIAIFAVVVLVFTQHSTVKSPSVLYA